MQWGILENDIGVFPIAFSQFVSTGDTAVRTNSSAAWYGSNGQITLSQIKVYFSNYTNIGTYIAVGMQQWGYNRATTGDGTAYDLLIACSDFNLGYISDNAGAGEVCGCTATLTSIQLSRATRSFTLCWFTLGKQQWGFHYEVKSNNPFNLPISYTEAIFCVVATAADWTSTGAWWYKNGATLNKIAIGIGADDTPASGNFTYLAIGVQQWGLNAGRTVNYPIPLTALYSILAIDAASDFDAVQVCNVNNVNLTSAVIFQMRLAAGDILPENMTGFYWLLAGQAQQWGLTPETLLPTVDFPVAFIAIPAVVGTPIKDYATSENYFGNNSIENVANTSFVARQTNTNGGTKAGAIRFIAIGY